MQVTFYGAIREVTGSMHLVATEHDRILFDCGLYQGRRKEAAEKNKILPFDPEIITNMILSHAHIDHSGRIPLLTKKNFSGRIICTRATASACQYLLPDSAHIQESDANYLNYKTVRSCLSQMKAGSTGELKKIKKLLKKSRHELDVEQISRLLRNHHLKTVQPLYTKVDAEHALTLFAGYPYRHPVSVGKNTTCTFYEAGHILGSALSLIKTEKNGTCFRVAFTGDIGRFNKPIIKDPNTNFNDEDRNIDLLIMESTYGNRTHEPVQDLKPRLQEIITETYNRNGSIIIPSFAFGRTQELLYVLHELYDEKKVPKMPVYVDSPLATHITKVFGEHPEVYDQETHRVFLENGKNPFSFEEIKFIQSVEESIALNKEEKPHIVLSASGMCEAGRILHHLRYKIHNPNNTILIVGYMAQNTLGRKILEQGAEFERAGRNTPPPVLKILNKEYPLQARVVKLGGFSAHGDKDEMIRFLKESKLRIKKIALVHGEEDQSLAFAEHLENEGFKSMVPRLGETVYIE